MKKPVKVTFVKCDEGDWEGLYANDELFVQSHSVESGDFLELISEHKMFEEEILEIELSDEQMEELGNRLPKNLTDVMSVLHD